MSDNKIERSRSVYDLVAFIAEVSGFADIFMVLITFFLGLFHHPKMFEAALIEHMDTKVVQIEPPAPNDKNDSALLKQIILQYQSRLKMKVSLYLTFIARYIPARYRSKKANRQLKAVDQTLKRIESKFDVLKIMRTHDDVELLLSNLLNSR